MNTRRSRKQSLLVAQQQDNQENHGNGEDQQQAAAAAAAATTTTATTNNNSSTKTNIVRAFLETWRDVKREKKLVTTGGATPDDDETMFDEISSRLIGKGFAVSSKLVKHKIGNFVKKYQYVKKCENDGKKIEWLNYDIVKQIFELDGKKKISGLVVIPMQNIKSEDALDIEGDLGMMVDDSAQAYTVKEERVELIEIPDEENYSVQKKRP